MPRVMLALFIAKIGPTNILKFSTSLERLFCLAKHSLDEIVQLPQVTLH